MNELIVRDASFAEKHQFGESDEPAPIKSGNWRDATGVSSPGQP
jgi:hypothetical protein